MKHITTVALGILFCFSAHSQVGIGTTNPQASLDIPASSTTTPTNTDGILIPRMDAFPITPPGANQDGMLVFITGNGAPAEGFYYWDNGTTSWAPLTGSSNDADWYVVGGSSIPSNISDNMYHLGNIQVGLNSPSITSAIAASSTIGSEYSGIYNATSGGDGGTIGYGIVNTSTISDALRYANIYNVNQGSHNSTHYGIENRFANTGTGLKYGIYNAFLTVGANGYKIGLHNRFENQNSGVIGVQNSMPGAYTIAAIITGVENSINSQGNGVHYGVRNILNGTGGGAKYGTYTNIDSGAGGIHYGLYSDVQKSSGYAGYFIGRTSFGTDPSTGRYQLPASDGTVGQVITTDGSGQLSFTTVNSTQNTLDEAYDEGGAGAGRTINVDTGSLEFLGSGSTTYTNVISHLSGGNGLQINTGGTLSTASSVSHGIEINNSINTNASFARNYGIFNKMTINGTATNGASYGSRSWFLPAGTDNGTLYGYHTENQNGGNGPQFGFYSRIDNSGNGDKNGVYSFIDGSGAGDKYGIQSVIASSAGGTHYAVYAGATQPSGYAGFFVGRASFGTDYTTGRYLLPAADGTVGQVMTTDGSGNLSFQTLTGESSTASNGLTEVSNDIQLGGSLTQATNIVQGDNDLTFNLTGTGDFVVQDVGSSAPSIFVEDTGDIGIGTGTPAYPLDILENDASIQRAVNITKSDNSSSQTSGLYITKTSNGTGTAAGVAVATFGSGTGSVTGYDAYMFGTGVASRIAFSNAFTSSDSGLKYGLRNQFIGASAGTKYAVYSDFGTNEAGTKYGTYNNVQSSSGSSTGLYNNMAGSTNNAVFGINNQLVGSGTGAKTGMTNTFSSSGSGTNIHVGLDNTFIDSGNGSRWGVRNNMDGSGTGTHYGTFNDITGTGTGTKYGSYNNIDSGAGGTHYGVYSQVSNANGWAGYFSGKNYISDGLGINNPNPDGRLDIIHNSTGSGSPHIMLTAQNADTGARITFDNAVETNNNWVLFARADNTSGNGALNFFSSEIATNVLRLESDGKVGIMRNPTTYALEVGGDASKTTAGSWAANSDRRLKKDITTIDGATALEKIQQMRGVTYYWDDDKTGIKRPTSIQYGFIAQELLPLFPEKVKKDNLGYYQTAYGDYDALFVQAIKELQREISELKTENAGLTKKLNEMEELKERTHRLEKLVNIMAEQAGLSED